MTLVREQGPWLKHATESICKASCPDGTSQLFSARLVGKDGPGQNKAHLQSLLGRAFQCQGLVPICSSGWESVKALHLKLRYHGYGTQ